MSRIIRLLFFIISSHFCITLFLSPIRDTIVPISISGQAWPTAQLQVLELSTLVQYLVMMTTMSPLLTWKSFNLHLVSDMKKQSSLNYLPNLMIWWREVKNSSSWPWSWSRTAWQSTTIIQVFCGVSVKLSTSMLCWRDRMGPKTLKKISFLRLFSLGKEHWALIRKIVRSDFENGILTSLVKQSLGSTKK